MGANKTPERLCKKRKQTPRNMASASFFVMGWIHERIGTPGRIFALPAPSRGGTYSFPLYGPQREIKDQGIVGGIPQIKGDLASGDAQRSQGLAFAHPLVGQLLGQAFQLLCKGLGVFPCSEDWIRTSHTSAGEPSSTPKRLSVMLASEKACEGFSGKCLLAKGGDRFIGQGLQGLLFRRDGSRGLLPIRGPHSQVVQKVIGVTGGLIHKSEFARDQLQPVRALADSVAGLLPAGAPSQIAPPLPGWKGHRTGGSRR